jgi:hypothetical protein
MHRREWAFLVAIVAGLASAVMMGCGGSKPPSQLVNEPASGSLVVFGTDQPSCDVESFTVTIQTAALVPQGGGGSVSITAPSQPVDFASLVDFTNILSFGGVTTGIYNQLTLTLASPQLTYLNTSASPPTPVTLPTCTGSVTSNCTSFPTVALRIRLTSCSVRPSTSQPAARPG